MSPDASPHSFGSIYAKNSFLPFEIVSIIAAYLYASHSALKACALTCRLWHEAIHQHRFCQVLVSRDSQLQDLLQYLESGTVLPHWVQEIVSTVPPQRMLLKMINLAPHLPRLHTLEFRGLQRDAPVDRTAITKVFSQFGTVDTLRFRRSQLSLSLIQSAACALPNLAYLELEQGGFPDEGGPLIPLSKHDQLRLISLRVEKTQQCAKFYKWIAHTESLSTLRSFSVDGVDSMERLKESSEFIRTVGGSLEHLALVARRPRIDVFREQTYKATMEHISLESNSNLRKLEIHDPLHPGITRWLDQLPFPGLLQTIVLHMPSRDVNSGYAELDKHLTKSEFSGLTEVHVKYLRALRPCDFDMIMQDLQSGFPSVTNRGLLRLTIAHL
ncbi:unnamed protein product [Somion occarium]|uniref:F-box domain-containing protein n=1 Tax=Somion occarium TaxID=3059160 RepID=A0ABP1CWY5_9APHY